MYKVCEGRQSSHRWNASTTSCSNGKQSPIYKKKPQFTRKSSSKRSSFIKLVIVNADKKSPSIEKREKRGLGITKYTAKKIPSPLSRVISPDPGIYAEATKEDTPVSEVILPQVTDGDASGDAPNLEPVPEVEFKTEIEQRPNPDDSQETSDASSFPTIRLSPRSGSPNRESTRTSSPSFLPQEKKGIRKKSSILLNKISSRAPSMVNLSKAVYSDTHNYIPTILCVFLFLIGLVLNIYFMLMFIPIFTAMLLMCPRDNSDRSLKRL